MVTIRRIKVHEARVVARILRHAFAHQRDQFSLTEANASNFAAFETAEKVRTRIESGEQIFLLAADKTPAATIGYRLLNDRSGYIRRLAVHSKYRNRGFGRRLMSVVEEKLRGRGIQFSEIAVIVDEPWLQQFYQRLGYTTFNIRHHPQLPNGILMMRKKL